MENTNKMMELRERVLEQIIPLLDTSDATPDEKFELTLQLAGTKGTPDLYQKAFDIVQNMAQDQKLEAYTALLEHIESAVQGNDDDVQDTSDQPEQGV